MRQRKPSHFGSYCQFLPSGILSTESASIGGKGRRRLDVIPQQRKTAGFEPAVKKTSSVPLYSGADPLMQFLLRRGADLTRGFLAILEQHQGRNRHDAILAGCFRVLVDIEFHDLDLVAELTGNFLERRPDHAARPAPFGPEIHDHRFGRFQNIRFKTSIRHFADGHGSYLLCWRGECTPKIARAGNYECRPAASRLSHGGDPPQGLFEGLCGKFHKIRDFRPYQRGANRLTWV